MASASTAAAAPAKGRRPAAPPPPVALGKRRGKAAPPTAAAPGDVAAAPAAAPAAVAAAVAAAPDPVEIRHVDPRALVPNPDNPRTVAPTAEQDAQLDASIRAVGLIQFPVVREIGGKLVVRAGDRRRAAAVRLGLATIPVRVAANDADADAMVATAENLIRCSMAPTDVWRDIERHRSAGGGRWNDEAIALALGLSVRDVRRLSLLGRIDRGMLKVMDRGVMPAEAHLRIIAAAPAEDQAAVWKRLKPRSGHFEGWGEVARALERRRMPRANALFGVDLAREFGVVWEEDLFAPADEDGAYTTNFEGFLAAQGVALQRLRDAAAAAAAAAAEGGDGAPGDPAAAPPTAFVILPTDPYGNAALPRGASHAYAGGGVAPKGAVEGRAVSPRTGRVERLFFYPPAKPSPAAAGVGPLAPGGGGGGGGVEATGEPAKGRADVARRGVEMVGDLRTRALAEAALDPALSPLSDAQLLALVVLAFAGRNVSVDSPDPRGPGHRAALAKALVEGGVPTADPEPVRRAARALLAHAVSLREDRTNSGPFAAAIGRALGADARLPTMATEEFLGTLSKAHLEALATKANVLPRNTGKETRAAMVKALDGRVWLHPSAPFAPADGDADALAAEAAAIADEAERGPDDDSGATWRDRARPGEDDAGGRDDGEEDRLREEALSDADPGL